MCGIASTDCPFIGDKPARRTKTSKYLDDSDPLNLDNSIAGNRVCLTLCLRSHCLIGSSAASIATNVTGLHGAQSAIL